MKRRDFLKGILSTPIAAVGLSKADTDLSVLNATPKPSEVEVSEDMKKVRAEVKEYFEECSPSCTCSCSPSASLSASGEYMTDEEFEQIEYNIHKKWEKALKGKK